MPNPSRLPVPGQAVLVLILSLSLSPQPPVGPEERKSDQLSHITTPVSACSFPQSRSQDFLPLTTEQINPQGHTAGVRREVWA